MRSRPPVPPIPRLSWRAEDGSTLLIALLILGAMSILASSVVVTAMGDRTMAKYERASVQALGAAETGIAMAKRAIVDRTANLDDFDEDGRPDFEMTDSLTWGGAYRVLAEASDIKGIGVTAYQSNGFAIVSEGSFQGARRRVEVEIVHDSFLKFARFVSLNDLSYECGAAISGEVYTGGNLNIPCGCTHPCQFLENVFAVGDIPNVNCGSFDRGYVTGADTIDLSNSFNWTDVRNKARGLAAENDCERRGEVGIYITSTSNPLSLVADAGVLRFDLFNWHNATLVPGDTVVTYRNLAVPNAASGGNLHLDEFNGIVFFEGAGKVKGRADGVSATNMTVFATTTLTIYSDVITGLTGYNTVTLLPDGSGDPVNIGLVAESYVAIDGAVKPRDAHRCGASLPHLELARPRHGGRSPGGGRTARPRPRRDHRRVAGEQRPGPGEGWNESAAGVNANTWCSTSTARSSRPRPAAPIPGTTLACSRTPRVRPAGTTTTST
ncbi:MAG: pilus assembly PilX N-terminal domain-containing protein [Candidatus Eisenbacteria bacterium]